MNETLPFVLKSNKEEFKKKSNKWLVLWSILYVVKNVLHTNILITGLTFLYKINKYQQTHFGFTKDMTYFLG